MKVMWVLFVLMGGTPEHFPPMLIAQPFETKMECEVVLSVIEEQMMPGGMNGQFYCVEKIYQP